MMTDAGRKRRKLWWVLLPAAVLLLLAMAYQITNWYGQRSWQEYLANSGNPRDAQLREEYLAAKIPDEENFAKTPLLERNGYRGKQRGGAVLTTIPLPTYSEGPYWAGKRMHLGEEGESGGAITAEEKEAARKFLDQFDPAEEELKELHEAAQRPYSRFDSGLTFDSVIPNYVFIRNLVRAHSLRAYSHLLLENPEGAFQDLLVVQRTAEGLADHPTLISAMINVAIRGLEKQPFYEGWALRQWTEDHYTRFQKEFGKVDLLRNFDIGLRLGEKGAIRALVENSKPGEIGREVFYVSNEQAEPLKALVFNATSQVLPKGFWQVNLRNQQETIGIHDHKPV